MERGLCHGRIGFVRERRRIFITDESSGNYTAQVFDAVHRPRYLGKRWLSLDARRRTVVFVGLCSASHKLWRNVRTEHKCGHRVIYYAADVVQLEVKGPKDRPIKEELPT